MSACHIQLLKSEFIIPENVELDLGETIKAGVLLGLTSIDNRQRLTKGSGASTPLVSVKHHKDSRVTAVVGLRLRLAMSIARQVSLPLIY